MERVSRVGEKISERHREESVRVLDMPATERELLVALGGGEEAKVICEEPDWSQAEADGEKAKGVGGKWAEP